MAQRDDDYEGREDAANWKTMRDLRGEDGRDRGMAARLGKAERDEAAVLKKGGSRGMAERAEKRSLFGRGGSRGSGR